MIPNDTFEDFPFFLAFRNEIVQKKNLESRHFAELPLGSLKSAHHERERLRIYWGRLLQFALVSSRNSAGILLRPAPACMKKTSSRSLENVCKYDEEHSSSQQIEKRVEGQHNL